MMTVVASHMEDMQQMTLAWIAALAIKGHVEEVLELPSSTKAGLGPQVQSVLTGMELCTAFKKKTGAWQEQPVSKASMKETMKSLLQLSSMQGDALNGCLPQADSIFKEAQDFVRFQIEEAVTDLNKSRTHLADFTKKYEAVICCLDSWDFENVKHLLDNSDSENGKLVTEDMKSAQEGADLGCSVRCSTLCR